MNIDELKDAWGQDEPKGMHLPSSTETLGKTTSVVGRIRKNMKVEFIALLICYVGIILFIILYKVQSSFFLDITKILLFSILILNCFYFFRFYVFYRTISRYDLNIKNNLRKIVYEMELTTEIYKTYNFSAMPLSVLTAIALISSKINFAHMRNVLTPGSGISANAMLVICAMILISYIITYFFISLHVHLTYGKYLAELKQLMNDLGEDD